MNLRQLPHTDLRLSRLGLGSWAFGGSRDGSSGLGPQDDRESVATIHRAPYCEEHGIGALAYSTLKHGLLTGGLTAERIAELPQSDWRRGHPDFTEPRVRHHLDMVATLRAVACRHERSCAEVAIAWTLSRRAVVGAIVGSRRPAQIDGLVGAANLSLSDADMAELDASRVGSCRKVDG